MSSLTPAHPQTISMAARLLLEVLPDFKLANSALVLAARTMAIAVIRQSLVFFIFAWLFFSIAPATLSSSFRQTTATVLSDTIGRSFPTHSQYYYQVLNTTKSTYEWSGLDNTVCKKYIACRAGEFIATDYTYIATWLKRTSWLDTISHYANLTDDSYVKLAVSSLDPEKEETCHQTHEPCEAWMKIESMLSITQPTPRVQEEEVTTVVNSLPNEQPVMPAMRGGLFNLFTARSQ